MVAALLAISYQYGYIVVEQLELALEPMARQNMKITHRLF